MVSAGGPKARYKFSGQKCRLLILGLLLTSSAGSPYWEHLTINNLNNCSVQQFWGISVMILVHVTSLYTFHCRSFYGYLLPSGKSAKRDRHRS